MSEESFLTIKLSESEYRKLVELAYLGEWMVNAQHDNDHQDEEAVDAAQALLGVAGTKGIERDPESGKYFLVENWTDVLFDRHILDYDDHVFWDELTERLALRDLARKRGVALEQIDRDEDILELRPLEDRYRRELERNGVERFEVSDNF